MIQDDVIFHNVGLVITDEQHRFGVNQRQLLRKRCNDECVIYDSNADTKNTSNISFGEMDVSSIKQLPKVVNLSLLLGQSMSNTIKF